MQFQSLKLCFLFIHVFVCGEVCVCACVCVFVEERERDREKHTERETQRECSGHGDYKRAGAADGCELHYTGSRN